MAQQKPILKKDPDDGTVLLRDGVTLAFFLPMPFGEVAVAVLAAVDSYLATLPPDALKWGAVGANADEWKPVTRTTVSRARVLLEGAGPAKRAMTAFTLAETELGGGAPIRGVQVVGSKPDPDLPDERNLVQFFFPAESLEPGQVEAFVTAAKGLAKLLPFDFGYGSPALQWSELHADEALDAAWGLAVRYPGYDVQYNEPSRSYLEGKLRGARWLTFLGPDFVARLGGKNAIRVKLPSEVVVQDAGHGTLLRSGTLPELGDRNRRASTPLLRAVAKLLEPETRFEEPALEGSAFGEDREDEFHAWERRFLD